MNSAEIYDPEFVKGMFDRMSKTYGFANIITSFGFTERWRRQCVGELPTISPNSIGYDLMSGMGECWGEIQGSISSDVKIIGVDISDEMNRKAAENIQRLRFKNIKILNENILENNIPSNSADFVVSAFGIKTFNPEQQKILGKEIARILKPGGVFSLIEISETPNKFLKPFYKFYLNQVIPIIGKVFLSNSEDYTMLGKYCSSFQNCEFFHRCLLDEKLEAHFKSYFFGCATGVFGKKS